MHLNFTLVFSVVVFSEHLHMHGDDLGIFLELFLGGLLMLFLDSATLGHVGIWMALRAKRHHRAVFATLARVLLVPWAAIFGIIFFMNLSRSMNGKDVATLFAFWFGLGIVTDLFLAAKARAALATGFRHCLAETAH